MAKGIVVFDTVYGNTEKIARALTAGLQQEGFEADCVRCDEVHVNRLAEADLLAVGGPTQYGTISPPLLEFLKDLAKASVPGKKSFAFDTRYADERAGSAARDIQLHLLKMGFKAVRPPASAIVLGGEGPLEAGAEEAFRKIGAELAKQFL